MLFVDSSIYPTFQPNVWIIYYVNYLYFLHVCSFIKWINGWPSFMNCMLCSHHFFYFVFKFILWWCIQMLNVKVSLNHYHFCPLENSGLEEHWIGFSCSLWRKRTSIWPNCLECRSCGSLAWSWWCRRYICSPG